MGSHRLLAAALLLLLVGVGAYLLLSGDRTHTAASPDVVGDEKLPEPPDAELVMPEEDAQAPRREVEVADPEELDPEVDPPHRELCAATSVD